MSLSHPSISSHIRNIEECPQTGDLRHDESSLSYSQDVLIEANTYLHQFHQECTILDQYDNRLAVVHQEIERTGSYWQTFEELAYGAKVAWRNNSHCIGRLHWQALYVRDMRHLTTAEDIFLALVEHIDLATNGGKIKPMVTVFAPQSPGSPGIRIWNPQLIRYAGYRQGDGSINGDPLHVELTEAITKLGWKQGAGTPFDVLPIVIQMPDQPPTLFQLPSSSILEVPIIHPDYTWFADLGLKWHALPAISNMRMEIGGVSYTAAPFNGWYMGSEIGARNLSDVNRYNLLPLIARNMGLDTRSDRSLWKDRALVELNLAVVHSFALQKITLVDHHAATRQFVYHTQQEKQAGRETPADWGWMVPPISGSTTPVFHCSYEDVTLKPNFFYQDEPWLV